MKVSYFCLLLVIGVITGCSGLKTYPNNYGKNLHIITDKDKGSFFSDVKLSVDIHAVDKSCQTEYQGTVKLDRKTTEVGIPTDDTRYLAFYFESSSYWSNSNSSIHYDTLLKSRDGYSYIIKVSYIDDIYNVLIKEISANGEPRELNRIPLTAC